MSFRDTHLQPIDIDIVLVDASVDPGHRPERRAIAALSIGMSANDAFYSVAELEDVLSSISAGVEAGKSRLAGILGTVCDDYQRAIYYALAGRGCAAMLEDLNWLMELLTARGTIDAEYPVAVPTPPYVAPVPDGPVGSFSTDFALGPSWRVRFR